MGHDGFTFLEVCLHYLFVSRSSPGGSANAVAWGGDKGDGVGSGPAFLPPCAKFGAVDGRVRSFTFTCCAVSSKMCERLECLFAFGSSGTGV
jgi:hypothetical protein